MQLGLLKEGLAGETRVALVPETLKKLAKLGIQVVAEKDAGAAAGFTDADYAEAGATSGQAREAVLRLTALACVHVPGVEDCSRLAEGAVLVGLLRPTAHLEAMQALAARKVSAFSFDSLPRITRAQSMDVLSSLATVAGYRAGLLAAEASPRFFPMLMTAAGTITPASVLVIGAGVAGLQAIATTKRLGAVVHGYDVRPAVKEQVESLGGRFVELAAADIGGGETAGGYAKAQTTEQQRRQGDALAKVIADMDVVITTAAIPDQPAPRLVLATTVAAMRHGSVIVDLAAESGGNCELTRAGETVVTPGGVKILGPVNLPAQMPKPASQMYSRNVLAFLMELAPKGEIVLDLANEVLAQSLVVHGGDVRHAKARERLGLHARQQEPT